MLTGQLIHTPCPVKSPDVLLDNSTLSMVDDVSPQIYALDSESTPLFQVLGHTTLAGVGPPLIAAGASDARYVVTGTGIALVPGGPVLYDLAIPMSAGAYSDGNQELAVVSDTVLKVFSMQTGQPLKFSAVVPPVNGMPPVTKLVAYSNLQQQLFIVAGNAAGDPDVVYTVPR
jgi:hypothetical protein